MKVFSTIVKLILLSAVMTVATTSCDSDIDPVYVLSGDSMELMGGSNEIILTPDNPQALALTVYWSGDGRLALSDTLLQAPVNVAEITIQFSKDEHFTAPLNIAVDKNIHPVNFFARNLILCLVVWDMRPMRRLRYGFGYVRYWQPTSLLHTPMSWKFWSSLIALSLSWLKCLTRIGKTHL